MNILRRLPLSRLLLLCAVVLGVAISATALASALRPVPTPPARALAPAIHDALAAPAVQGYSANVQLTNHLLEGAELTGGGGGEAGALSASPLVSGASGRLWISNDGRARLELQAEKGDTQILYGENELRIYDAATNTLYRHPLPAGKRSPGGASEGAQAPALAKIEEALSHAREHANISGPTPGDVAGRAAYSVRISPREGGSLIGGAELSWDAANGVPLRAAIYSSTSSAPVIELAASEVSYGPVNSSVFEFTPPAGAKVKTLGAAVGAAKARGAASRPGPQKAGRRAGARARAEGAKITTHGHGLSSIAVLEGKSKQSPATSSPLPEGLPKVKINGTSASELATALGTLLSFERGGVRYLILGAVPPAAVESIARGL